MKQYYKPYCKNVIRKFRLLTGEDYNPRNVPAAIKWTKNNPWINHNIDEQPWEIIANTKKYIKDDKPLDMTFSNYTTPPNNIIK